MLRSGKITVRHRVEVDPEENTESIDFKRRKRWSSGNCCWCIEYDPNRTANIALISLRRRRESLHPRSAGTESWNGYHEWTGGLGFM
ncbi:MAG: hypothetical protein ACLUD2_06965 [Clostridium sp.]